MAKLPVVQEVCTTFGSLGDLICGDPQAAGQRWSNYAGESFLGSGCCAAYYGMHGDFEQAREYGKGMGRATGQALLGGGILEDTPTGHILATTGKSLGHMIGGWNHEAARKEWVDYSKDSMLGSPIMMSVEACKGNWDEARMYSNGYGRATARYGVTAAAVGAGFATGSLGAPAAVATSAAIGAGSTAAIQKINGQGFTGGDIVGNAMIGGVLAGSSTALDRSGAARMGRRNALTSKQITSAGRPNHLPPSGFAPRPSDGRDQMKAVVDYGGYFAGVPSYDDECADAY